VGIGVDPTGDGFSFVYQKTSGDYVFTARRIASSYKGGSHQRIGIMVRQSLDAGAKAVALVSGDQGARMGLFGARQADNAAMSWQLGNGYTHDITWFRLKRSGDTYTAYQSIDGITWYAVGSPVTVPMSGETYAGLAVSSNGAKLNSATFDNVSIDPK
jgi:hypothetical protein